MEYSRPVKLWLFIGVVMVFFQIVIGGITRLTGSGLSITKWEIVTGTLPPMTEQDWSEEFDLYRATPQYEKINQGMSLKEFKFIYFWEYIHRLWARMMGLVFLIPFIFFLVSRHIDKPLIKRLLGVVLLAAVVASFGWIMVASGLIERPWVNAYKLSMHLCLGLSLFCYLFWVYLVSAFPSLGNRLQSNTAKRWLFGLSIVVIIQIFLGGMMSGMKAGLAYPTWPLMNGEFIPSDFFSRSSWSTAYFTNYDQNPYMVMIVQVFHRLTAYLIAILTIIFGWKFYDHSLRIIRNATWVYVFIILLQVILGILTVINCKGEIPLWYGVAHQAFAIFVLTALLFLHYIIRREK